MNLKTATSSFHEKIIVTNNMEKTYRRRKVVDKVSLFLKKREIVGLLGANGAGKTTCFNMMIGMVPMDKGSFFINGLNMTKMPMYKRARMGLAYLPQEASIFRKLSVEDNILAILQTRKEFNRINRLERLEELLESFKITKIRKTKGYNLSGGERRRLEIARALATNPDFLFLDEPFAGIDPIAVEEIQEMIFNLKEQNMGILITDHSVRETLAVTDRSYIMFEGKILVEGTTEYLTKNSEARRRYLGSTFDKKTSKNKKRSTQKEKPIKNKIEKRITKKASTKVNKKTMSKKMELKKPLLKKSSKKSLKLY